MTDNGTEAQRERDPYFDGRNTVLKDDLSTKYQYSIQVPRGATPQTWPQLLHDAVGQVCPGGEYTDAEYLNRFERRYGPCSTAHLVELAEQHANTRSKSALAADATETSDVIEFVLLMLGVWPDHPLVDLARTVLLQYLNSPHLLERMASATSISHLHDERAVPILIKSLTDGLPEPTSPAAALEGRASREGAESSSQSFDMCGLLREEIPELLVRWKVREAIPALRQALALTVQIEREEARRTPQWRSQGHWRTYQRDLVIALGRFGAFGALTGIEPPEENMWRLGSRYNVKEGTREPIVKGDPKTYLLQRWQVLLCYHAIHQQLEDAGRHGTIAGAEIQPEVERLLAEQFGMNEEARRAALAAFGTEIPPLTLE